MNKAEERTLRRLREVITLRRASLTPPGAVADQYLARARAINDARKAGEPEPEPMYHRPLADPDAHMASMPFAHSGDVWTNDVAESLRAYTESWALPLIDVLLGINPDTGEPFRSAAQRAAYLRDLVR